MITTHGPRYCPGCEKPGRLLPVSKTVTNPLFRKYHCQSCHWQGIMLRPFKKQSRAGFYAFVGFLLLLLVVAGVGLLELLKMLPEQ